MGCLDDDTVLAFLEGRLPAEQAAGLEAHIDACAPCRQLLSRATQALPNAETRPQQSEPSSLIGREVGSYRVTGFIGAGAMGAVYLGEHTLLKRRVAIKVMHSGLQSPELGDEGPRRFFTEAQALARIKDTRYVIQLFDFGRLDEGTFYYVMEYLEGRDLERELRRRGPLRPEEALPYVQQLCAGLQAAHDSQILHRDLKPANVFVLDGEPLRLKLLDFGLAKLVGAHSSLTLGGLGSPLYAAAELIRGEHEQVGPRTDIYALGVILYRLLAARLPYDVPAGAEPLQLFELPLTRPPTPLRDRRPEVPEAVAAVVDSCLAREPAKRPGSAAEVARAYERALGSIRGPEPSVPVTRPPARRRWIVAGGLALLVAGATLAAVGVGRRTKPRHQPTTTPADGVASRPTSLPASIPAVAAQRPTSASAHQRATPPAAQPAPARKPHRSPPGTGRPTPSGADWVLEPDFEHGPSPSRPRRPR